MKIKFKQIISNQWEGDDGKNHSSLYGLSEDGDVYIYKTKQRKWERLGNDSVTVHQHKVEESGIEYDDF